MGSREWSSGTESCLKESLLVNRKRRCCCCKTVWRTQPRMMKMGQKGNCRVITRHCPMQVARDTLKGNPAGCSQGVKFTASGLPPCHCSLYSSRCNSSISIPSSCRGGMVWCSRGAHGLEAKWLPVV